ncbi:MAG: TVP38/TMEM64 family protein [bacterium]|nr:TVP38/TMEM64 family protein [bacterium]
MDTRLHVQPKYLGIAAVVLVVAVLLIVWEPTLPTQATVERWVQQFGAAGPLAIIGFIALEVVIAPIPGGFIPITVGALFGVWPGVLYTWLGNVIGSLLAFALARYVGRPLVTRFVKPTTLERLDTFLHRSPKLIWLVYMVPVFPIDIITFAVGLSAIPFRRFVLVMTVGFVVSQIILTTVGGQLLTASGWQRMIVAGLAILVVLGTLIVEHHFTKKGKSSLK